MDAVQADNLLREAIERHQAGQIDQALALYQTLLRFFPGTPLILYNLGVIALDRGETDQAIDYFQKAIAARGDYMDAYASLGLALKKAQRFAEAVEALKKAIALAPLDPENYLSLAEIQRGAGCADEAEKSLRYVLLLAPKSVAALVALADLLVDGERAGEAVEMCGDALAERPSLEILIARGNGFRALEDHAKAEADYRKALELAPGDGVALANLARLFLIDNRLEEALSCCDQGLAKNPDAIALLISKARIKDRLGQSEEALATLERLLRKNPDHEDGLFLKAQILHSLKKSESALSVLLRLKDLGVDNYAFWLLTGSVYVELGRNREGAKALSEAFRLEPDSPVVANNLGAAFLLIGMQAEAKICYRKALLLDPDMAAAHNGLSHILGLEGNYKEAVREIEQAERLEPGRFAATLIHFRQKICDWDGLAEQEAALIKAFRHEPEKNHGLLPFSSLTLDITAEDQLKISAMHARGVFETGEILPQRPPHGRERLRIGYLSADFHVHPVTRLIVEMLERHDQTGFEVVGYSYGTGRDGEFRQRVRRAFHRFEDIWSLSYAEMARKIHQDEIDILIDLSGYTTHSRSRILGFRPAPIQVSYLGYPGTMGYSGIDYIVADERLLPERLQPCFAENIVRLPDCYQTGDSKRFFQAVTRAEEGVPEDAVLLMAFNNSHKISPEIFSVWMRALEAEPKALLWLLAPEKEAKINLQKEIRKRGVDEKRVLFAERAPPDRYMGRLALGDLFLDCFPFNAGATANDALWAGTPIVTLMGDTYVSRMGGALLTAAGLPELIASSLADYEEKILALISDPQRLAALKKKAAEARDGSPLFDVGRFTRNLEKAYRLMWDAHKRGKAPGPINVAG